MPRGKKTKQKVAAAFHEVIGNEPSRVKQTRRTRGAEAAKKQRTAIALDEARKAGARIPKK
jgi:hypothetical protein